MHRVEYDDGDEEMLDLDAQTWHVIPEHEDDELVDDGGLDQLHSAAEALAHVRNCCFLCQQNFRNCFTDYWPPFLRLFMP